MNLHLTESQRGQIKRLHRGCKQRRFADKLKAILLLDKGFSCIEVGQILLLDDDTVRAYRKTYTEQGVEALLSDNHKGKASLLSAEQLAIVEKHLTDNVYMDSKGIIDWVTSQFGVVYSNSGINDLLKRLGFVYKKPVLTPCKANVEKQQEFVKQYQELKEHLEQDDQIYFMDGVHPQHNTIAGYGWIKKGQTKHVKTNSGRQRTNINGALNLATKQLTYLEDKRINSQSTIALLELLLDQQNKGKIYVVLDNARYYHAKIVKEFLEKHPRVVLKFLPPYSPNLNIIERLWKILKKQVVYNTFYLKFDDFKKAVIDFLENQPWLDQQEEKSLNDNFQIIKPNFSGSYMG